MTRMMFDYITVLVCPTLTLSYQRRGEWYQSIDTFEEVQQ